MILFINKSAGLLLKDVRIHDKFNSLFTSCIWDAVGVI